MKENNCLGNCILCGKCYQAQILDFFDEPVGAGSVGRGHGFGIAIDIGTTTVVMALLDFGKSEILARHSFLNPQRVFGPDVISRIDAANKGHLEELGGLIRDSVASNIHVLMAHKNLKPSDIAEAAVAANTTMTALLLGFPCKSLGAAPFAPDFSLAGHYRFADVFMGSEIDCPLHIMPWMAAFVGGDITSGLLFALQKNKQLFMLIDLGTNGEILLYNKGKITVTATAAGPAFEQSGKSEFSAASDVISALAELVRQGIVDETGALENEDIFSQKHVRDLQLAKSAIRSGLEILIEAGGTSYDELEKIYLAGGIGQHININDAVTIGLIPESLKNKAEAVGNSSLGGAVLFLRSPEENGSCIQKLAATSVELNLAKHPRFNECFMEFMCFEC